MNIPGPVGIDPLGKIRLGKSRGAEILRQPSVQEPFCEVPYPEAGKLAEKNRREMQNPLPAGQRVSKPAACRERGGACRKNPNPGKVIGRDFKKGLA